MMPISPMDSRIDNGLFNFCVGKTVGGMTQKVSRVISIDITYWLRN